MAELVGVATPMSFSDAEQIRKAVLFFDRIAYPTLDLTLHKLLPEHPSREWADDLRNTLDLLVTRGIVLKPALNLGAVEETPELSEAMSAYQAQERAANKLVDALAFPIGLHVPSFAEVRQAVRNVERWESRIFAAVIRDQLKLRAVPICPPETFTSSSPVGVTHTEVIQLVIKELPVPGEGHSMKDILDFREEARAQGWVQGLRDWMNDMASGTLTEFAVSDRLEHLMSQYRRALDAERMSRDTTWLETFFFPAEGTVAYLTTLASKLFAVRRAKIDLMKAEMAAPGREVAFIVRATEQFEE